MIDPQTHKDLKNEILERILSDKEILENLRSEIRAVKSAVKRIQPRATTSISLVGTDGGNNQLQFDPFMVQIVRVVDSSNNQLCLEVITPTSDSSQLSRKHIEGDTAHTALGEMMKYLEVTELHQLTPMIRKSGDKRPANPSWVQVYRELIEWAVLFSLVRNKDFGTDTLIVCDGLLRSKVFAQDLFAKYLKGLEEGINQHYQKSRRRIYLAGVAKHSKVLARYRLAMALEGILRTEYPAYVEVPRDIEAKAYIWSEWARGNDMQEADAEINKFVGGKMFLVKFGNGSMDPIWPIDVFLPQAQDAQVVLGSMLADAINGFPVPYYPMCLQKAHENAALVDFDFDILQDHIIEGIRKALEGDAHFLDVFRLQDSDPAQKRYS